MLFLSPVTANLAPVSSGANLRVHLKAHLTIEFNPRAQINAQSRAARIITILVSKFDSAVEPLCALPPLIIGAAGSGFELRSNRGINGPLQFNKISDDEGDGE
ncbi:hypothetical protein M9H77_10747 [Catharanthus roseus]|uniref:Uncharacterized protein n=1 Tax=Catharanthus roseus TaxID=4058 RepID=A0ACC0BCL0_CATRO|nr:hypothetical protein M9H77_10747 [Catharanthus roseus]